MENLDQKITVQIVLYEESFEIIKKCLINLKGLKVIIVDNKNDQELKKKITEEFIVEHYISNKKNIGYSKAHNQASSYVKTNIFGAMNPNWGNLDTVCFNCQRTTIFYLNSKYRIQPLVNKCFRSNDFQNIFVS